MERIEGGRTLSPEGQAFVVLAEMGMRNWKQVLRGRSYEVLGCGLAQADCLRVFGHYFGCL